MADPVVVEKTRQEVLGDLGGTPYACSALYPLSGGYANFVFRGVLKDTTNGPVEVAIKHGKDHAASDPNMAVPTYRCRLEKDCLAAMASLGVVENAGYAIRTPHLYYFDDKTNIQVQEYVPDTVDLKQHALAQSASESQYLAIGRGLGEWLRNLHEWGQLAEQSALREQISADLSMQSLKNLINYTWLVDRIETYPALLSDARAVFEEVRAMAKAEVADSSAHRIIHGDFWTGNILLPRKELHGGDPATLFVIDWEACQMGVPSLDLGQMIAEMWKVAICRGRDSGRWLIRGFVAGYGAQGDDFAFRTAIAVGTHLISFSPYGNEDWGSPENIEESVRVGKDVVVNAWKRNREWFTGGDLECLFG